MRVSSMSRTSQRRSPPHPAGAAKALPGPPPPPPPPPPSKGAETNFPRDMAATVSAPATETAVEKPKRWSYSDTLSCDEALDRLHKLLLKEGIVGLGKEFRKHDSDGSNELDHDEFLDMLHDLDIRLGSEEQKLLFEKFDPDCSGDISFNEFIETLDVKNDLERSSSRFFQAGDVKRRLAKLNAEVLSLSKRLHLVTAQVDAIRSADNRVTEVASAKVAEGQRKVGMADAAADEFARKEQDVAARFAVLEPLRSLLESGGGTPVQGGPDTLDDDVAACVLELFNGGEVLALQASAAAEQTAFCELETQLTRGPGNPETRRELLSLRARAHELSSGILEKASAVVDAAEGGSGKSTDLEMKSARNLLEMLRHHTTLLSESSHSVAERGRDVLEALKGTQTLRRNRCELHCAAAAAGPSNAAQEDASKAKVLLELASLNELRRVERRKRVSIIVAVIVAHTPALMLGSRIRRSIDMQQEFTARRNTLILMDTATVTNAEVRAALKRTFTNLGEIGEREHRLVDAARIERDALRQLRLEFESLRIAALLQRAANDCHTEDTIAKCDVQGERLAFAAEQKRDLQNKALRDVERKYAPVLEDVLGENAALAKYEQSLAEEKFNEVEEKLAESFRARMAPMLREAQEDSAAHAADVAKSGAELVELRGAVESYGVAFDDLRLKILSEQRARNDEKAERRQRADQGTRELSLMRAKLKRSAEQAKLRLGDACVGPDSVVMDAVDALSADEMAASASDDALERLETVLQEIDAALGAERRAVYASPRHVDVARSNISNAAADQFSSYASPVPIDENMRV